MQRAGRGIKIEPEMLYEVEVEVAVKEEARGGLREEFSSEDKVQEW